MSETKQNMLKAFQRIVGALEKLSEDDLSKLFDESYNIEIRIIRKRSKEENLPLTETYMPALILKLTSFVSREEAQDFLNLNCSTRKTLEPIARNLDIPIMKQDKVETLRDKIIEATVGARIRSQAIQGNSD